MTKTKTALVLSGICLVAVAVFTLGGDGLRCPSQYATAEEAAASFQTFSNNFYATHPNATLHDLLAARVDFYKSHHCTQELAAYQQAMNGTADPATMKIINAAIQAATSSNQ